MGWEQRGNQSYYYRKKRVNGQVRSEYVGRGAVAQITYALGEYRDKLLTTTQTRYLRAIEGLAKVRRLARNTPSLQINIAQDGGKQINVQGEVSGQKVP